MNEIADETLDSLVTDLMKQVKNTQMTEEEYRYITSFLGDKNLLVFGLGRDTPLWQYANKDGKTVFLEHDAYWVEQSGENVDARVVEYNTTSRKYRSYLKEYRNSGTGLEVDLPEDVREISWDVIIVDAPVGSKQGRMGSIFEASRLGNKHVFVHDCDRRVEQIYCDEILKPENLVKELTKLRHYDISNLK